MKRTCLSLILLATGVAFGQQTPVGKWSGIYTYETRRGAPASVGIQLTIASAEGENVAGTWTLNRGNCQGDYPLAGTFKDNKLRIKTEAGSKPGCGPYGPTFTLDGDKLVGKFGKQELTLTK